MEGFLFFLKFLSMLSVIVLLISFWTGYRHYKIYKYFDYKKSVYAFFPFFCEYALVDVLDDGNQLVRKIPNKILKFYWVFPIVINILTELFSHSITVGLITGNFIRSFLPFVSLIEEILVLVGILLTVLQIVIKGYLYNKLDSKIVEYARINNIEAKVNSSVIGYLSAFIPFIGAIVYGRKVNKILKLYYKK